MHKRSLRFVPGMILLTLLVIGQLQVTLVASDEREMTMNKENQEVLEVVKAMTAAFQEGDIDAVMGFYEDQANVLFEPGKESVIRSDIEARFSEFSQISPRFEYLKGHEVYVAGDLAMHIAPWSMTGTAPDGSTVEQSGLSVAVLRKQEDGKWLLVLDNPHGSFSLQ
ncbi:DUF4440 domain-containing protein [Puniceicoccaceae bacterium K14]|nr:DUF4440 domain-containing protein [Puniceicoccaceae bacterium K14]